GCGANNRTDFVTRTTGWDLPSIFVSVFLAKIPHLFRWRPPQAYSTSATATGTGTLWRNSASRPTLSLLSNCKRTRGLRTTLRFVGPHLRKHGSSTLSAMVLQTTSAQAVAQKTRSH